MPSVLTILATTVNWKMSSLNVVENIWQAVENGPQFSLAYIDCYCAHYVKKFEHKRYFKKWVKIVKNCISD